MLIISDDNAQMVIDESLARTGGMVSVEPRRTTYGSSEAQQIGLIAGEEQIKPYPESEWPDRIKAMAGRFIGDVMVANKVKCKDQNGLGFCWTYSLTSCVEVIRLQQGQGYVELNPESLGGDVGWRNAGNSLDSAIAYARTHGICERRFSPPHNLKTGTWQKGWEENALGYKPAEWFDLDGKERWPMTVTALLSGYPVYVGYDWWRHALIVVGLTLVGSEVCLVLRNSWGSNYGDDGYFVLKGNKKYPSYGCFAPRSVTWNIVA